MQRDEVVGAHERPDVQLAPQPAHRAESQHVVATGVQEAPHVGCVVDPVRLHVRIAVAGDEDRVADVEPVDVIATRDAKAAH